MSLIGKNSAVISLGMSCQTVFQIERARAKLSAELGEELEEISLPFDWRIVGAADVAAMLQENILYPSDAAELTRDRRRYWERRCCWFWHDKWDDFARFQEKQLHLLAGWGKLAATKRQIFVASNTQNNLREKQETEGGFGILARLEDLFTLQARLEQLFPAPELHFVTRAKLMADLQAFGFTEIRETEHVIRVKRLAREGVHLHILPPDKSQWQGPDAAWEAILVKIARIGTKAPVTIRPEK